MRRQMTLEDLNQVAQAVALLDPEHVISVSVYRSGTATVLLTPEALADVAEMIGEKPRREPSTRIYSYWRLWLTIGDMELAAMAKPEQLPLFGLPVEPLPAEEEPAQALQAS